MKIIETARSSDLVIYAHPCEIAPDESGELVITFPDVTAA